MFAFLASFLSFVHINLIGELYISELLFALYLLFSVRKIRLLAAPFPRRILVLGGLWLISQMLTDWYRGTPSVQYLRGWASIIFFLLDFGAVYMMVRQKPIVILVLIFGSSLGTIFSALLFPSDYTVVEPWKFGYGASVTMLAMLYISKDHRYETISATTLLLLIGLLSVYLNARSLGGMTIITAIAVHLHQKFKYVGNVNNRYGYLKILFASISVLISIYGVTLIYQWAAESGYLPAKVTEKYLMGKTKDGGLIGLVAGGRPEILISSQAVIDSPIIGYGSWAEDANYSYMRYKAIATLGLDLDEENVKNYINSRDLIPTHSVIMQAWVWAGILGAIFWFYILRHVSRVVFLSFSVTYPFHPLVLFSCITSIWNILFSPFGANQRISWSLSLALLYIGVKTLEQRHVVART